MSRKAETDNKSRPTGGRGAPIRGRLHYLLLATSSLYAPPSQSAAVPTGVKPAQHASRQGIGRALIGAADAWARDRGLAHLTLHAGARNAGARAFYAALGFVEEEVRLTRPL